VVLGIGVAAVFTCSTVALLALYRDGEQDRVMGWRATATTAGGFVWPLAAGALGNVSWHAPFAICLVGLPLGVATLLVLPAVPVAARPAKAGKAGDAGEARRDGAIRLLRAHPRLLALCGLWIATTGLMMVFGLFLPRRLDELGVSNTLLVAVYGIVLAAGVASLVGLTYARLRARLGYAVLLRIAAASRTGALVVFAVAGDPFTLLLVPLLTGLGSGIAMPTLTVLVDRSVPQEYRGTAASLQATALFGGQFASPPVFGPLIDSTSITTGALVAAGGTSLILLALFRLTNPPEPQAPASAQPSTAAPAPAAPVPSSASTSTP
jgi:predicted MFS family arabinose efflux permease